MTKRCAAQLKVNLRPVWAASVAAIVTVYERFPDVVGPLILTELHKAEKNDIGIDLESPEWEGDAPEDPSIAGGKAWHEEERTWRDGNGHRVEKAKAISNQFDSTLQGKARILEVTASCFL